MAANHMESLWICLTVRGSEVVRKTEGDSLSRAMSVLDLILTATWDWVEGDIMFSGLTALGLVYHKHK